LWPRTTTATAARAALLGGDDPVSRSRTLEIVMDAAYAVPDRCSRSCTGNFFVDEDMPVESGVTPLHRYRAVTGGPPVEPPHPGTVKEP